MNKIALYAGSGLAAAAMLIVPASAAMAATPTNTTNAAAQQQDVSAISGVTTTVVTKRGMRVYQTQAKVTGAVAGQQVALLNANGTPATGFKVYPFAGGNTVTTWYTPGSAAGNYILQIGTQRSAPFYLPALTGAPQGL